MNDDKQTIPPGAATQPEAGLLQGVKVVEIGQNIAGPFCGRILAGLGADVVKIEKPTGDDARAWGPPFVNDAGPAFHTYNLDKRSLTVDLNNPAARDWLIDFIGTRDILIHNLRPGVMEKLGLGADVLCARHPRLIYGGISGFGSAGPLRNNPAFDVIVQAIAGIFSINGDPQGRPSRIGMSVLDMGTGLWVAVGCLAALRSRDLTGKGSVITGSLFETALNTLGSHVGQHSITGQQPRRDRAGAPGIATFECFRTADGEILLAAANDRLFAKLARVVGRPEWIEDPRLRTNADRLKEKDYLCEEVAKVMCTRSTQAWVEEFAAVGFPCAPIHDLAQALNHPQTLALDILETIPGSAMKVPRLPITVNGVRPPVRTHTPRLGSANDEFLPPGF